MAQNEQTTVEHSTLEQQSPGRLDHPAWCVAYASRYKNGKTILVKQKLDARQSLTVAHPAITLAAC